MASMDYRKSDAFKKRVPRFFQYLVLGIMTLIIVVPIVIMVFGALKTRGMMFLHPYTPPIPPPLGKLWDHPDHAFILDLAPQ